MKLGLKPRIVGSYTTSVTAIRDNKQHVTGWQFHCHGCNTKSVKMAHQRSEAIAQVTWHQCRAKGEKRNDA